MLEPRKQMHFALKPISAHRPDVVGREHLDDDLAIERRLRREEDAAHSSAVEFAIDPVRVTERALQLFPQIESGHRKVGDPPTVGGS